MMRKSLGKRIFAMTIAGSLCLSGLAACGGEDKADSGKKSDNGKTTIRVCWWGNQTRNDATVKALDMYEKEHPEVDFEVEFSDWTGYWDKMSTQAAGGNMPDIIQMDYAYIRQYAEKGQIVGMNQYIEDKTIDTTNIPETIIDSGKIEDEVYGISAGTQTKALLVNEKILKEAGCTLEEQPTWDEFLEVAKTVYDKTGKQIEIPSNDEQTMLFMARAVGQTMFNEAGDGLGMPDDEVALKYYTMLEESLKDGYHVAPEIQAEASTNQQSLFASEDTWCQFQNSNQITDSINQCGEDMEYKIYMFPTEEDAVQQPIFLKPSMFWSITKDSKHPEIAADVINYLTNSEEANKEALKGERGVPVSTVVSESIASVVDEVTANINAYVTKVAETATPIDPPFPTASAEVGKTISDLADMVRYEEISPEEAAEQFYETATELLKKGAES